jgi:hypothetical protein
MIVLQHHDSCRLQKSLNSWFQIVLDRRRSCWILVETCLSASVHVMAGMMVLEQLGIDYLGTKTSLEMGFWTPDSMYPRQWQSSLSLRDLPS